MPVVLRQDWEQTHHITFSLSTLQEAGSFQSVVIVQIRKAEMVKTHYYQHLCFIVEEQKTWKRSGYLGAKLCI